MKTEHNDNLEEIEWGGVLNEFLWTCAGVNKAVLRQCPSDYAKYAGIGGTILFTALMAMLSGGYALYTVFDNEIVATLFGVFWGLLIFNLDRFIVNTMYSDGKPSISLGEFFSGLPRIVMAVFLGIVISTPLELKIFEDEINIVIDELAQAKIEKYKSADLHRIDSLAQKKEELQNSPISIYHGSIVTGNESLNKLLLELKNKKDELEKEESGITKLTYRINATTDSLLQKKLIDSRYGYILKRNALRQEINTLNGKIAANDQEIKNLLDKATQTREEDLARIQKEIDEIKDKLNGTSKEYEDKIRKEFGGFQARMLAFSKMKEEHSSTEITSLFIMLLFIIIETAPTFFKMMLTSGPYDDLLRSEMHKARVMSDKRISDINDEINTEIMISTEKNKNKLEAEVLANKELLNQIAQAQSELLSTAIEEWRKSELKKIEENPSAYIQTNAKSNEGQN